MERFDVVVIGAGPGGYIAAIRCAQLGLKAAVIDQWQDAEGQYRLGGTCLNVGCIPSKALLDSSEKYDELKHQFSNHGIDCDNPRINISRMMQRKRHVVNSLTGGIAMLFLKHKIAWLKGSGRLLDNKTVEIVGHDPAVAPQTVTADNIIIATGSHPRASPLVEIDNDIILDSTGALALTDTPRRLLVIGGGVVGLELGSVWQRLGSEVIVLVRGAQFLNKADDQISKAAFDIFMAQGLDIRLNATPTAIKVNDRLATVTVKIADNEQQFDVDKVLVAVGREPNTQGLNAAQIGVAFDAQGFIVVDDACQTRVTGIYAIGDVVRGPMLAHKASEEGVAVAERIAGQKSHVNYDVIPWVIYTSPEIAWVGPSSQELKDQGRAISVGVFPFKGNGRALAMGKAQGMVKLISDAKTDALIAAHILGPFASELIAEAVVTMEFGGSAEDLARTVHAHPTLSEAMHEAALATARRALHC